MVGLKAICTHLSIPRNFGKEKEPNCMALLDIGTHVTIIRGPRREGRPKFNGWDLRKVHSKQEKLK